MTVPRKSRPAGDDPSDSVPALDSTRRVERPSSTASVGTDIGTSVSVPVHVQKARRAAPVTVTVQYVLVEGGDGEALARRQAAALRYALTCPSHSDEPETPERSGRRDSGNEPNEDNNRADHR
ncbi:hypothetical protein ACOKM3_26795 [Streptomyces sp. BH106]|uniref:hypothetical protein n=1 Tax=Streptomyces sp. BH106 TaxID=3410409 RepID=UPI003CECF07F